MVLEAIESLGTVAIGATGAGLVARYGIQRFSEVAEQGIEQFFDREMARYRSELEDERVVFSRLHEERASIVVELYERLLLFEQDMRAVTAGRSSDSPTDELLHAATASGDDFTKYYEENKIYFPPETCDAVERLQDEMNHAVADFRTGTSDGGRPERRAHVESWRANWRDVTENEVPELKRDLEDHFRALLGVDVDGGELEDLDS